jgi:hypothetical protein
MKKLTQADRVLVSLTEAGSQGITQADWLPHGGMDGLGKITRLAARIEELRKDGLAIKKDGQRQGFAVYKLVLAASTQPGQKRVEEGGQLFDLPAEKPSSSHWEAA